ncbi:bifunctional glutamate N-acetyltransferase/amino-acid acetyltransferase ArgJ [Streptomyces profundus]|uniref:bifunctional glutamate N-acetyltransferase/amino-acid acetyltransferase ArgJ n=1 Tax=Streptomyces profundus TaxID=2867410 RepID=UPI001D162DB9|nr:bifunctional glutamate N-acetyltransferase/amino-acid acetyltransferase ArgJ [Streptomyces sp. MA3_2.13]UED85346.1 bifunctional glutamate N-acetyltransferase/amino-acid acetyltransferase ArgJ [Streptomyces sp. MA3_2.13]
MANIDAASVVEWPEGFTAHAGHGGVREAGDDVSIVASDRPTVSAAVFTQSRFAGPSVLLSRGHAAEQRFRAVVTVAGNSNVATGPQGERNSAEVVALVAGMLNIAEDEVLISSTGVIGRQLPMELLRAHLGVEQAFGAGPLEVAGAMMTTDTHAKVSTRTVGGARIVGVAKGVGMVEPNMATMLAYLFTDAAVAPAALDAALRDAVDRTFNCLSVDTDTSTSDTVALLANGAAGEVDAEEFAAAVHAVCLELTEQLARDGEGATKLLRVQVTEAASPAQAKRIAKSVLNSPLVKTAVHGADPNWGRVVMAVGKNTEHAEDLAITPERVTVRFGAMEVYPSETDEGQLAKLVEIMRQDEVEIGVTLGLGDANATVFGCDLSDGYVRINADYTT